MKPLNQHELSIFWGGQFAPVYPGQFAPESGGQFQPGKVVSLLRNRWSIYSGFSTISNDRYIEELQNTYKHLNLSVEEAYRYAFGNYYKEKDFHNRPMAKLTKDIAIEMGTLIKVKKP